MCVPQYQDSFQTWCTELVFVSLFTATTAPTTTAELCEETMINNDNPDVVVTATSDDSAEGPQSILDPNSFWRPADNNTDPQPEVMYNLYVIVFKK